jgi:Bacteriocin-protection, YdeI or OmpD-Associated
MIVVYLMCWPAWNTLRSVARRALELYYVVMIKKILLGGLVHDMPADLESAITVNGDATAAWENISQLARNEWICWTITCKKAETRAHHIKRAVAELAEGKRRPCCWPGCPHRSVDAKSRKFFHPSLLNMPKAGV